VKFIFVKFILSVAASWLFFGCSWFDKDEPVPSYLTVNEFTLNTLSVEGSSSHRITDGWIYVDNELMGAFELPCVIPVLKTGPVSVKVYPGIMWNLISAERKTYPFYEFHEQDISLTSGEPTAISPVTSYYSDIQFWIEDFEDAGLQFTGHSSSATGISLTGAANAFEGGNAGKIVLTGSETIALIHSTANFSLPKLGERVFIEMNYKCNQAFRIGVYQQSVAGNNFDYVISASSTESGGIMTWKKAYIEITEQVSSDQTATTQDIYFEMYRNSDDADAELYIDNIKVLYFN
jgi:hypothetical protein